MAFLGGRSDFNLQECWGGPGCAHPPATGILGQWGHAAQGTAAGSRRANTDIPPGLEREARTGGSRPRRRGQHAQAFGTRLPGQEHGAAGGRLPHRAERAELACKFAQAQQPVMSGKPRRAEFPVTFSVSGPHKMQPGGAGREAGAGLLLSTTERGAVLPGAPLVSTWGLSKCPPLTPGFAQENVFVAVEIGAGLFGGGRKRRQPFDPANPLLGICSGWENHLFRFSCKNSACVKQKTRQTGNKEMFILRVKYLTVK